MSTSPKSSWKPQARFRRVKIRVSELEVSGSWGLWGAESLGLGGFLLQGPRIKVSKVETLVSRGFGAAWDLGFRISCFGFKV